MFYLITILSAMAVIFGVNMLIKDNFYYLEAWKLLIAIVIATIAVIIIAGIIATIIRYLLPKKWFTGPKTIFSAGEKERRFYEKIGIKKWKDKVLELGMFTSFSKKNIAKPKDLEYIDRYIMEANFGAVIHLFCMIGSPLVVFVLPLYLAPFVTLPVALVSIFLHFLPMCILRYNLKKLHVLYKFNLRKNKETSNCE